MYPGKVTQKHSASIFFIIIHSRITHLDREFTVTRHCIFWCAWESISKNLRKSQLDIEILILSIIQLKDLEQFFVG